jgi:hypothetical protein
MSLVAFYLPSNTEWSFILLLCQIGKQRICWRFCSRTVTGKMASDNQFVQQHPLPPLSLKPSTVQNNLQQGYDLPFRNNSGTKHFSLLQDQYLETRSGKKFRVRDRHKGRPLDPLLRRRLINPVHVFTIYLLNVLFESSLPRTSWSSKWSLSLEVFNKKWLLFFFH